VSIAEKIVEGVVLVAQKGCGRAHADARSKEVRVDLWPPGDGWQDRTGSARAAARAIEARGPVGAETAEEIICNALIIRLNINPRLGRDRIALGVKHCPGSLKINRYILYQIACSFYVGIVILPCHEDIAIVGNSHSEGLEPAVI